MLWDSYRYIVINEIEKFSTKLPCGKSEFSKSGFGNHPRSQLVTPKVVLVRSDYISNFSSVINQRLYFVWLQSSYFLNIQLMSPEQLNQLRRFVQYWDDSPIQFRPTTVSLYTLLPPTVSMNTLSPDDRFSVYTFAPAVSLYSLLLPTVSLNTLLPLTVSLNPLSP